ncbi:MAG: hypothetical protein J6B50_10315 [Lachnospiraceae bacterium]|nr:hypothetical protein [Lachnospiraceae bacterium]
MNRIELKFDKSDTRLAGFPYGKMIYDKQVKDNINYDDKIMIVFPTQIEKIASSFVQGFFAEIVKNIGYAGIEKQVDIVAGTPELVYSIKKNIY